MKILHTADLHLDAVMGAQFDADTASRRRTELLRTFERMVDYAAQIGVRVFLIAGDLFDSPHPAPSTEQAVMSRIAAHPEIDFLVLGGAHANGYIPVNPPKNYRTFPARTIGYYRYDNVVIAGTENNAAYHELSLPAETVNIVMLHGQLSDAITDLSVVNLKFWKNMSVDYLALGYMHRAESGALDVRGTWAYAGIPEGLGFEDGGTKGFRLLEIKEKAIAVSFMPFAQRTLHTVTVDISRLFRVQDMIKAVREAVSAIASTDLLRVVLRGVTNADMHIDTCEVKRALQDSFFYVEVRDETNVSLRPDAFAHDKSLRGEFVRTVLAAGLDRADAERIIRCGIQALGGEEVDE